MLDRFLVVSLAEITTVSDANVGTSDEAKSRGAQFPDPPTTEHKFTLTDLSMANARYNNFVRSVNTITYVRNKHAALNAEAARSPEAGVEPSPAGCLRRSMYTLTDRPFAQLGEHHPAAPTPRPPMPRYRKDTPARGLKPLIRRIVITREPGWNAAIEAGDGDGKGCGVSVGAVEPASTVSDLRKTMLPFQPNREIFSYKKLAESGTRTRDIPRRDVTTSCTEADITRASSSDAAVDTGEVTDFIKAGDDRTFEFVEKPYRAEETNDDTKNENDDIANSSSDFENIEKNKSTAIDKIDEDKEVEEATKVKEVDEDKEVEESKEVEETKEIDEDKEVDQDKEFDQDKEVKEVDEVKEVEEAKEVDQDKGDEEVKEVDQDKVVEEVKEVDEVKEVEEAKEVDQDKVVEEVKKVDEVKEVEESKEVDQDKGVEEAKEVEVEKDIDVRKDEKVNEVVNVEKPSNIEKDEEIKVAEKDEKIDDVEKSINVEKGEDIKKVDKDEEKIGEIQKSEENLKDENMEESDKGEKIDGVGKRTEEENEEKHTSHTADEKSVHSDDKSDNHSEHDIAVATEEKAVIGTKEEEDEEEEAAPARRVAVTLIPEADQPPATNPHRCYSSRMRQMQAIVESSRCGLASLLLVRMQQADTENKNKSVLLAAIKKMKLEHAAVESLNDEPSFRGVCLASGFTPVDARRYAKDRVAQINELTAAKKNLPLPVVDKRHISYDRSIDKLVFGGKIHLSAGILDNVAEMLEVHGTTRRMTVLSKFYQNTKRAGTMRRFQRRCPAMSGRIPPSYGFRRTRAGAKSFFVLEDSLLRKMIRSAGRKEVAAGFNYNCKVSALR